MEDSTQMSVVALQHACFSIEDLKSRSLRFFLLGEFDAGALDSSHDEEID